MFSANYDYYELCYSMLSQIVVVMCIILIFFLSSQNFLEPSGLYIGLYNFIMFMQPLPVSDFDASMTVEPAYSRLQSRKSKWRR